MLLNDVIGGCEVGDTAKKMQIHVDSCGLKANLESGALHTCNYIFNLLH